MRLKLPRPGGQRETPEEAAERRAARAERSRERPERRPEGAANPLLTGLQEVAAIGREMLRIPAGIALLVAERLGLVVLAGWRWARPRLLAAGRLARRGIRVLEREVTPARATAVVALAAAALLAVTQFVDYRDVQAGVPAYEEVENVAPPPVIEGTSETAGSAHLYVLVLIAIAAAAVVVMAMMGRWRLARVLFFLGLAAVAVAVAIDAPTGLDEGEVAGQFTGAEARLLDAFWVEVFAAGVIAVCGPLLALHLRPESARRRTAATSRPGRERGARRLGGSGVEGARS